jgi:CRP/FNR family cyclic AMP-dependent transcriptional regulator
MKKILVIEDEFSVRENIAEILQLSDYEVLAAADGITGVEIAISEVPDLIICDITMPGLDGYQVLCSLTSNPRTAGVPFIFLTASMEKSDLRKGMAAGADDYLTKPFEGIELLRSVESCFNKHEHRKMAAAQKDDMPQEQDKLMLTSLLGLDTDQRDIHFFRKKQMIYAEGQRPVYVYYLVTGKVKIFRIHSAGKEFITSLAGPGDLLGYAALLRDVNYEDNAQVVEDARLMLVPGQEFLQLMTGSSHFAQQLIDLLAKDLKTKEQSLVNLAYNSLRKRVANGLLQLTTKFSQREGGDIPIGISRENLSHFIGSATESLTRTLSDFRNEKLIDIRDGKIYLLDKNKLGALAN